MKRIVICADGTWNRPEQDLEKDVATNVLRLARAVKPVASDGTPQVVFYDWGLGSYHDSATAGGFGDGIDKNIADDYRFLVQNYDPGDELYFFGFSRGAYTVRSLAGLMNNCSILKRRHARLIAKAYDDLYKKADVHPRDAKSREFRRRYAVADQVRIRFVGVWDTVGALGVPIRMLGFLNEKHLFHDNKIGPNIDIARHALAIDERRDDFEATIWKPRPGMSLQQVWFAGAHSDVGGGHKPDEKKRLLSDVPFGWMIDEAERAGLELEPHLRKSLKGHPLAAMNESFEGFFRVLGERKRKIPRGTFIHPSVKERWEADSEYRPHALKKRSEASRWKQLLPAQSPPASGPRSPGS